MGYGTVYIPHTHSTDIFYKTGFQLVFIYFFYREVGSFLVFKYFFLEIA